MEKLRHTTSAGMLCTNDTVPTFFGKVWQPINTKLFSGQHFVGIRDSNLPARFYWFT